MLFNVEYLFESRYVVSNIFSHIFLHFFQPAQGKRTTVRHVRYIESDIPFVYFDEILRLYYSLNTIKDCIRC